MGFNIAIDGPAGAGKSHHCLAGCKRIIVYLCGCGSDVPRMALYLLPKSVDGADTEKVAAVCKHADISIEYKDGQDGVLKGGKMSMRIFAAKRLEIWLL